MATRRHKDVRDLDWVVHALRQARRRNEHQEVARLQRALVEHGGGTWRHGRYRSTDTLLELLDDLREDWPLSFEGPWDIEVRWSPEVVNHWLSLCAIRALSREEPGDGPVWPGLHAALERTCELAEGKVKQAQQRVALEHARALWGDMMRGLDAVCVGLFHEYWEPGPNVNAEGRRLQLRARHQSRRPTSEEIRAEVEALCRERWERATYRIGFDAVWPSVLEAEEPGDSTRASMVCAVCRFAKTYVTRDSLIQSMLITLSRGAGRAQFWMQQLARWFADYPREMHPALPMWCLLCYAESWGLNEHVVRRTGRLPVRFKNTKRETRSERAAWNRYFRMSAAREPSSPEDAADLRQALDEALSLMANRCWRPPERSRRPPQEISRERVWQAQCLLALIMGDNEGARSLLRPSFPVNETENRE